MKNLFKFMQTDRIEVHPYLLGLWNAFSFCFTLFGGFTDIPYADYISLIGTLMVLISVLFLKMKDLSKANEIDTLEFSSEEESEKS